MKTVFFIFCLIFATGKVNSQEINQDKKINPDSMYVMLSNMRLYADTTTTFIKDYSYILRTKKSLNLSQGVDAMDRLSWTNTFLKIVIKNYQETLMENKRLKEKLKE